MHFVYQLRVFLTEKFCILEKEIWRAYYSYGIFQPFSATLQTPPQPLHLLYYNFELLESTSDISRIAKELKERTKV